jgi:putative tryptophan/tyrosine transport system substrate-binding protein
VRSAVAAVGLAAMLLVAGVGAASMPRIGLLGTAHCEAHHRFDAFRQGLHELGYVEGRSIALDCRGDPRPERLPTLAAELVRLGPAVLVTDGSAATRAAMRASRTIPIVMGTVGDSIGSKFVASLARPGGNVTGLTLVTHELITKRLELIREMVPGNPRLAVLGNPDNPITKDQVRELEAVAGPLGLTVQVVETRDAAGLELAFATMGRQRAGALLVLPDAALFRERTRIVALAARSRLPGVYEARFVEAGGLIAYGPRIDDNFRRAAVYVDKILKGAKPADLPMEQPTKFDLVVNLKTARALGLTIPQSVLAQATQVIHP